MKPATVLLTLSSEMIYICLMIITWVVLLGWAAALIGACTLAFRNRNEDHDGDDPEASLTGSLPSSSPQLQERAPTPLGFGL